MNRLAGFLCGAAQWLCLGVLLVLLLGGCALETATFYGTGESSAAFTQCRKENFTFGMIPAFGVTYKAHFEKCMQQAGWERMPGVHPEGPEFCRRTEGGTR